MRALVQRVLSASVVVDGETVGAIGPGLLVLVGVHARDHEGTARWMAKKLAQLRVFADEAGKMNRALVDVGGEALVVSQFTLYGDASKGNRPSYIDAAPPAHADPLYRRFAALLATEVGRPVPTGVFGADMKVSLVNDGPVTLWLERDGAADAPVAGGLGPHVLVAPEGDAQAQKK
jgi:D-tyrosyl-tRNA(Tyr) deacylase